MTQQERAAKSEVAAARIARIGIINYITAAPILEIWQESVAVDCWQIIRDNPASLNEKMLAGEIDMGFISSAAYAKNPEKYLILPGLSISAAGPAGSLFLFSHIPLEQLDGANVLLTSQAAASAALTKIVLEEFYQVNPIYVIGDTMAMTGSKEFQAALTIGDDALKLVESSDYLYQFDLGDIWKRETDLPFVCSLFVVQRDFAEAFPHELFKIHNELLRCRKNGMEELDRISEIAAPKIPMEATECREYLAGIEYDLSNKKRESLEKFFSFLVEREKVPPEALSLQFFSYNSDK